MTRRPTGEEAKWRDESCPIEDYGPNIIEQPRVRDVGCMNSRCMQQNICLISRSKQRTVSEKERKNERQKERIKEGNTEDRKPDKKIRTKNTQKKNDKQSKRRTKDEKI